MKFTNYVIALTGAFATLASAQSAINATNASAGGNSANAGAMLNGFVPSIAGAAVAGILAFLV
ncbi:HBL197Wp [Eremothecium sinecaudum]|uniref:HBL197Wp n=1 Tax=Eremothecium sinecaudum TaxID=45286 RepID=A0A120K0U9_9SACH|nr:HBL197Wp [Eremothecium sinecaudum]AMD18705.1 HBL197Wp [Eremothecium sinecaudum]